MDVGVEKEIILVDDCSTDATAARVQELNDPRVRLVRMPSRSGQSLAQREGFRVARFETIIDWSDTRVAALCRLNALTDNAGFDVGVGPSVVVVDEGMGRTLTTVTAKQDVYAFVFGQQGLMGGIGVQGNKITKVGN